MEFKNIEKIALVHCSFEELPKGFESISNSDAKEDINKITHWRVKLADFLENLSVDYDTNKMSKEEYSSFKNGVFDMVRKFKEDDDKWYLRIKNKTLKLTDDMSRELYLELVNKSYHQDEYLFKAEYSKNKDGLFSCSIEHVDTSRPWTIVRKPINKDKVSPFDFKEEILYLDENNIKFGQNILISRKRNVFKKKNNRYILANKNLNLYSQNIERKEALRCQLPAT